MTETFDYIIVGAGSAGCVLANRLSADGSKSVLLVEAGPSDRSPLVSSTLGFAYLVDNPKYDWRFKNAPEPGLNHRELSCPRGKVLGGSSSINAMFYIRGLASDFAAWAARGNSEWTWAEVEPWYRKLETFTDTDHPARGKEGPVHVQFNRAWHPVSERMLEGAEQAGLGRVEDFNAEPEGKGLGRGQLYLKNCKRQGSAAAHLRPAMDRSNLRVVTGACVQRLTFSGSRATGILYRVAGREVEARGREIILSAGVIGTPQLLEISGIGQEALLAKLNIPLVKHLPAVGENLRDHFLVPVARRLVNTTSFNEEARGWRAVRNLLNMLLFKKGYFAGSPSQVGGQIMVATSEGEQPVQFIGMPCNFSLQTGKKKTTVMDSKPGAMMCAYAGRPRSKGHVHIQSADIDQQPEIVANFFQDPLDQETTLAALKACRAIFEQPAFEGVRGEELAPGPGLQSDEELLAFVKMAGNSAYHPVGTCAMGTDPATSVVDTRLRVHGIDGLRVVDASVMPELVSANTHCTTVMIAERAAEWILAGS